MAFMLMNDVTKEKFLLKMNFASFAQMTSSMVKIIDEKVGEKLHWSPLVLKDKDNYIKSLLMAVHEIKSKYPWALIPTCQKSHFLDARAENDKVLEFLLGLSSTAACILVGSEGNNDLLQLTQETAQLEEATLQLQKETKFLRIEHTAAIEKNLQRPKKLLELKNELISTGIVTSLEEATLEDLLKKKEAVDEEHLQVNSQALKSWCNMMEK